MVIIRVFSGFFIVLLLTIFFIKYSFASDKNVICNELGCSGFSGNLFSESVMLPGDTVSKTFSVKNERGDEINIKLDATENSGTDQIFKEKIVVVVYEGASILFSGTFETFLNTDVNLGVLNQNQTKNYEINISFPSDSGNEYQNKVLNFDLSINITGEESGEVLSTTTNSSITPSSTVGTILGLTDTGGITKVILLMLIGITFITLGARILLRKNTFRKIA